MNDDEQIEILCVTKSLPSILALQYALTGRFRVLPAKRYEECLAQIRGKNELRLILIEHSDSEEALLTFLEELKNIACQIPIIVCTQPKRITGALFTEIVLDAGVAGFIDGLLFDEAGIRKEIYRVLNLKHEETALG